MSVFYPDIDVLIRPSLYCRQSPESEGFVEGTFNTGVEDAVGRTPTLTRKSVYDRDQKTKTFKSETTNEIKVCTIKSFGLNPRCSRKERESFGIVLKPVPLVGTSSHQVFGSLLVLV